ncbi:insulinase family protein [Robertmurraya korlensis]|uniref:EF-P 5-aminopentanol modification-associated protein YfmH n=1 Tax=Robertmurraya korlensis TaxID=519977 RepID=UPI00203E3646|nr:pitrilysin family protein [Robertmurraya korlensis]MCM3600122.1 insulinase family protein [Robertmurraya korlensis]
MEKISFDQLQEELYHEKLENGLEVYILPKKGFNKTYATFTTKYGSIDNHFVPAGKKELVKVPDGIAHFLEHKLFEKEDGDVFQQFSRQGASANAFTSFTRTAYLFSSTSDVEKNLETLIDFVQYPYFSEKTVEKEKGIIGQEIDMYDDNPDWRLYFGAIQNLFENHPVKIDIAGTKESIAEITKDMLYECYHTFYHPSNMLLFIVGPVQVEEIMKQIKENQAKKTFPTQVEIERKFESEKEDVSEKKLVLPMNVHSSKCLVSIKATDTEKQGEEMLKQELTTNVLLELLFGRSSENYDKLYSSGLIDESFSFDYTQEKGFGFAMIGGDTNNPDQLATEIKRMLEEEKSSSKITVESLERTKKKKIGAFLRAVNSPEYIANQFTRYAFNDMNLFDVVPVLEAIKIEDIHNVADNLISENRMAICQVVPKS